MTYYISHSGVQGMKWYNRRYQYADGSLTPLGRIHYGIGARRRSSQAKKEIARRTAEEQKRVAAEREVTKAQNDANARRNPREMSDQELQALVNRLRNEQAYLQLTGQDKTVKEGEAWYKSFGKKLANDALSAVSRETSTALAKTITKSVFGDYDKKDKNKDKD